MPKEKKKKIIIFVLGGFLITSLCIALGVFAFIYLRDKEEGETIVDFISDEEDDDLDEDDLDEDDGLEDEEILDAPVTQGWELEGLCIENSEDFWDPEIIELNDGSFRMYYEEHGEGESSIKSMISDDGLEWEAEDGIRMTGANMPTAIQLPSGTVYLYYAEMASSNNYFSMASSSNGLNFTKVASFKFEKSGELQEMGIRRPSIIQKSDGSYLLYYDGMDSDENTRIFVASSEFGIEWEREGTAIEGDVIDGTKRAMTFSPDPVVNSDGSVTLFYVGGNPIESIYNTGIYKAESDNGIQFDLGDKPEISAYFYEGDDSVPAGVEDPISVLFEDGSIRLYYSLYIGEYPNQEGLGIYSAVK